MSWAPSTIAILAGALLLASCSRTSPTVSDSQSFDTTTTAPTTTSQTPTTTAPSTTAPSTTSQPVTTLQTDSYPGGATVQGISVAALGASSTPHVVPSESFAEWRDGHNYEAADLFVEGQCGGTVISPVNGTVVEVRRIDEHTDEVDNPATRGGRSVTIIGDDGVRYYLAHFDVIVDDIEPGVRVSASEPLGTVGETGRAGACHIHFGISPACPDKEWSVRRGVIGPIPYLDSWENGENASPVEAVEQYLAANPDACVEAAADPNAASS